MGSFPSEFKQSLCFLFNKNKTAGDFKWDESFKFFSFWNPGRRKTYGKTKLEGLNLLDKEGKLYYTEMQKKNTGNLIRRSRYFQAQIDVSLLEPGSVDFNRLNESCFILIMPFDIFGRGLYRYTFEETCRECPDLRLEDGAVRVFINTKGRNRENFSQEFLDLIEYITKTTDESAKKTDSNRIRQIHDKVSRIRKSEKAGIKYIQRWEEIAYAREDGRGDFWVHG